MSNYPHSGKGLKNMYDAQIGSLICTAVAIIPFVNVLAGIGMIIFTILTLVGVRAVGKDISGCKTAFWLMIGGMAASVVGSLAGLFLGTIVTIIFTLANSLLSLAAVYYICSSVAAALRSAGAADAAKAGDTAWKIRLWTTILSVVATLLALIPVIGLVGTVLGLIATILSIVAMVFYIIFLNKAYKVFTVSPQTME